MARPTRLLIVDDDPSLADLMASQLRDLREAFSIRVETDPNDALDAVDEEDIDCVLSDYHMPEMNGLELLRYVRQMDPSIPFILFTARGSEEIASDAVSEGVTDYFRKRRGEEQWRVLANRIENAAARYRAEQAVHRREDALRELTRTVIDSVSTPVDGLLELGRETLDLEYAALLRVDDDESELLVESVAEGTDFATGNSFLLSGPLDDALDGGDVTVATADESNESAGNSTDGERFRTYIGAPVYVGDRRYGTICFCDRDSPIEFTAWERAFVELLANLLGHELTDEWARDQSEAVRSAKSRLDRARDALDEGDEATVRAELDAIEELLEREPPASIPVSVELS
ncbi:response regulator [Natronomonas amylolytica]|uniref:response regulator n=1 Tax=Natronomonas amylolytica TaxID=3108498 RepID=UPI00300928D1